MHGKWRFYCIIIIHIGCNDSLEIMIKLINYFRCYWFKIDRCTLSFHIAELQVQN